MATQLRYHGSLPDLAGCARVIAIGPRAELGRANVTAALPTAARDLWPAMVNAISPGDASASTTTWLPGDPPTRLTVIATSARASRHNSPCRPDVIAGSLRGRAGRGRTVVIVALAADDHAFAAGCAVARALSTYSRKTRKTPQERVVDVALIGPSGVVSDVARIDAVAEGIRLAAHLVDTPPSELHTDAFVERARGVAADLDVEIDVLDYEQLVSGGFGGLVGVGRAATHKPALVHLRYAPEGATRRIAWVGKGIVYDTGGLSIKTKTGMPGMKTDMGGAAAVLGAFHAAVTTKAPVAIDAVLCLAENSVGPSATRPDDILAMYSGKTVEVNNTDAEGRLVLADGVAYAARHLEPAVIVDVATLTGAQLIATGKRHAAIVSNNGELERSAVRAGVVSGDLVHPLPYSPEFFRSEFKSEVADLKNSVKDRMNAQSSCAGQFIAEHLGSFSGEWLHIDIAGPNDTKERGTGFGVALLVQLFGAAPA